MTVNIKTFSDKSSTSAIYEMNMRTKDFELVNRGRFGEQKYSYMYKAFSEDFSTFCFVKNFKLPPTYLQIFLSEYILSTLESRVRFLDLFRAVEVFWSLA